MPPKRAPKCSFYEGSRKCGKDSVPGTNPPLCRAHQEVLAATAQRRAQHPVVGGLEDLFNAWSQGSDINMDDVIRTGVEAIGSLGSLFQGMPSRQPRMPSNPDARPWSGAWDGMPGEQPRQQQQRHTQQPPPPRPPGPGVDEILRARRTLNIQQHEKLTPELLKARYRKLAVKHHPDRGGTARKAAEINSARDLLLAELKRHSGRA